jgi:hypothetical protein
MDVADIVKTTTFQPLGVSMFVLGALGFTLLSLALWAKTLFKTFWTRAREEHYRRGRQCARTRHKCGGHFQGLSSLCIRHRSFPGDRNPNIIGSLNLRVRKLGLDINALETSLLAGHCFEDYVVLMG